MNSLISLHERNNSIEFFRFFFMLVICMWHFNMLKIFKHGYLAVEFFFILSGFFLFYSFLKRKDLGVLDFIVIKFKRFFPEFVIVLILTFLIKSTKYLSVADSFYDVLAWLFNIFDDLCFLFSTGPFTVGVVNPTWYLSVLIWGGGWMYAMLKYYRNLSLSILFPLLIIIYFGYIGSNGGNLELWFTGNGFFLPLIRGMSEMAIGVYLYIIVVKMLAVSGKIYIINILSVISLFGYILLLFVDGHLDIYSILFIPFILLGCFMEKSWFSILFKNEIFGKMGGITYEMLLIHWPVLMVFRHIIDNLNIINFGELLLLEVLYLLIVILLSIFLKKLYRLKLNKMFNIVK